MWEVPKQEYTSAKTSLKQVPAGFSIVDKYFGWQSNTTNLDIGGGKYDLMTEELLKKHVTNLIYDPYNRTKEHNVDILYYTLVCNLVETVTIFNVLNVIKEYENQIEVLELAHNALQLKGRVFVRSAYMNPTKVSGVTKSGTFQHHKTQKEYLELVKEVFPNAKLEHSIIHATR